MNKLKQLLSPTALAATVATGMLLHSTLNALAGSCYQVSAAVTQPQSCYGGRLCSAQQCSGGGFTYYWCCGANEACWYCVTPTTWPYATTYCCP